MADRYQSPNVHTSLDAERREQEEWRAERQNHGQRGWQSGQSGYGSQDRGSWQGSGHSAQGSTGHGTHGYGGQSSGYSLQEGGGYNPQQGGYGSQGGGYGAQSSYASHGGYGSQGHDTHGGYGSQGGYGPQGGGYGSQAWARGWGPGSGQQGWPKRRGPKGYQRSDERIREDICEHLMHSAHIDCSEVTVEVKAGKVTLEGTVPERRMKHAIEDMAEACAGVTDVENRVRVSPGEYQSGTHGSTGEASKSASSTAKLTKD